MTYLKRKQVNGYGVRYRVEHSGECSIVIPLSNTAGELQAVQCISENGDKRIYGAKKGNFHVIGTIQENSVVYISEGYATGASVHQAAECPVVVAFDCGNLKAVASNLRQKYPHTRFIIAGDDDTETTGNPGRTKAEETGNAIECSAVFPIFVDGFKLPCGKKPTDYMIFMFILV